MVPNDCAELILRVEAEPMINQKQLTFLADQQVTGFAVSIVDQNIEKHHPGQVHTLFLIEIEIVPFRVVINE